MNTNLCLMCLMLHGFKWLKSPAQFTWGEGLNSKSFHWMCVPKYTWHDIMFSFVGKYRMNSHRLLVNIDEIGMICMENPKAGIKKKGINVNFFKKKKKSWKKQIIPSSSVDPRTFVFCQSVSLLMRYHDCFPWNRKMRRCTMQHTQTSTFCAMIECVPVCRREDLRSSYPWRSGGMGRGLLKSSRPTNQYVFSTPFPWKFKLVVKKKSIHSAHVLSVCVCFVFTFNSVRPLTWIL